MRIQATIEWKFYKDPKSGFWVALCPALKQTVSAPTYAEMNECIGQTLELLFQDLLEKNELRDFLRSHGWTFDEEEAPEKGERQRFDVPWSLVERQGAYDNEGALC